MLFGRIMRYERQLCRLADERSLVIVILKWLLDAVMAIEY